MDVNAVIDEANTKLSIMEAQRNEALNQVVNSQTQARQAMARAEELEHIASEAVKRNIELTEQLNSQAEELERLRDKRSRKRKTTDG
jgi:phage shock protein A